MEAQCGGAIPVTFPFWAVGENVRHGCFMSGPSMTNEFTRAEGVQYVARLVNDPELQERIRVPMMAEARRRCSWEHVADQWERVAAGVAAPSPQAVVW
jgi:hypothetical protein